MLRLRTTGHSNGKVSMTVWAESGTLNVFATAFLIDHSTDPLNTARADFEAINRLHIAAELFDISDFEYRLSYGSGLSRVELKSINEAFRYKTKDLSHLLENKRQGVIPLDIFHQLKKLRSTSQSTILVRKSSLHKYLKWLVVTGDAALNRFVISSDELAVRRNLPSKIAEAINLPKRVAHGRRSKYNPIDLSRLEEFLENYDPQNVWPDPYHIIT